ncbi:unannotated protein [freshwater metagenome]|uniref:Unannotated protein n=1 Tax=freshwater metagenome TaxID=449393 RepID=A0A6J6L2B8_9ZZZZ
MGVGVGVGVGMGVGVGVGLAITTPLFHTNFFPLLMQVYFFPADIAVDPALEHFVPGVMAAYEICVEKIEMKATVTTHTGALLI